MQKVEIVESSTKGSAFRLIINTTDEHSTGIVLTRYELEQLAYRIKDALDTLKREQSKVQYPK